MMTINHNPENSTMTFEILPTTPCDACLNDRKSHAVGQDGAMIAVYCEHHQAGGVFRTALGKWTSISPIDRDGFVDYCVRLGALHAQVVAIEDGGAPPVAMN